MDANRFDAIAQSFGNAASRRAVGRALAGGSLGALLAALRDTPRVAAKKKRRKKSARRSTSRCQRNCTDRVCGSDGCGGTCGTCGGNQVCHGGACCTPESRGATCAGRCGTWTNNCGQPVTCASCASGQQCLSNGSCATVCTANNDCTGLCNGCSNPSVEGARHCIAGPLMPTMTCTTTDDCPPSSHCQNIGIPVCIALCT